MILMRDLFFQVPQRQNSGSHMFGHNSQADRPRELFKHFNNAESLVVAIFFDGKFWV